MEEQRKEQAQDVVFALDIGTRSIIGVVGRTEGDRVNILAVEKQEHSKRAMIDGQIEDIAQVGRMAAVVAARLEQRLNCHLTRVCIAAAGRALHTEKGHFELSLPEVRRVGDELIGQLEAGAVSVAEDALTRTDERLGRFYLVGYTVSSYLLDNYPISTLQGHNGQKLETDVVATFLPAEVVESLYAAMQVAGLEVVSLTLEPIAAINAAIPAELRLLNLVMADIGAGTSDIAACKDGSVVGYTMATVAGDEITEAIMRTYLVDFATAERLKAGIFQQGTLQFTDILGMDQEIAAVEIEATIQPALKQLAEELARRIREINIGTPSAVFLAGGGSKLKGLRGAVAAALEMDENRVAIAGSNFKVSAFSDTENLVDPEYATPLGIVVSAGLGLISDSFRVSLNARPAKLFRSGVLTALDVLMMNGYSYADLIGRTGQSLAVTIDGQRTLYRGEPATPSALLINGKELPPSTVIRAADAIDFVPARSGQPGLRTLAEALGSEDAAQRALVNGMPSLPDALLHSGDSVETNAIISLRTSGRLGGADGEEVDTGDAESKEATSGEANPEETAFEKLTPEKSPFQGVSPEGATLQEVNPGGAAFQEAIAEEVIAEIELLEDDDPLALGPWWETEGTPAKTVAPAPVEVFPDREFFLNGEALVLPAKPENSPYYLMDLLDHTGLDFEHLEKPVTLRVNGEDGAFMRVLKDGDVVSIRANG